MGHSGFAESGNNHFPVAQTAASKKPDEGPVPVFADPTKQSTDYCEKSIHHSPYGKQNPLIATNDGDCLVELQKGFLIVYSIVIVGFVPIVQFAGYPHPAYHWPGKKIPETCL